MTAPTPSIHSASEAELLASPEFLANPYPMYAALGAADPVHWVQPCNAWRVQALLSVLQGLANASIDRFIDLGRADIIGPEGTRRGRRRGPRRALRPASKAGLTVESRPARNPVVRSVPCPRLSSSNPTAPRTAWTALRGSR